MKIAIIVEGKTEKAFIPYLREYLKIHLRENIPKLDLVPYDGRIPKEEKLKRVVNHLLRGKRAADYVMALTDVYTGSTPPDFQNAADAKTKMRQWTENNPRFHPHAAQYDFEAWLLPYWETIQRLSKHNRNAPSGNPEDINHGRPPSYWIKEIFEIGACRDSYIKPRDAGRILKGNDLSVAVRQCPELKSFVNTIILLSEGLPSP